MDIPGNTAYWFFAFFWLTEGSRNKNQTYILSRYPCAYTYYGIWLVGQPWGPEGGEHIGNPSYFNIPPDIGFTLFTPIKGRIDSLTVYIYKAETCTNILKYNTCMSSYPGDRKWTKIEP